MSDIRLFSLSFKKAKEISPQKVVLEREIQNLVENNLEEFFSVRLLASEYTTGEKHKGRIDTLGIDENNSPVIIEYKLHTNENVINQGLYYMDWLLDHKAEFELLLMKKMNKNIEVEWQAPRLLCIADNFTKYDSYAVDQISRNIELIRYKIYQENLVLFELVNAVSVEENTTPKKGKGKQGKSYKGIKDYLKQANVEMAGLWKEIDAFILGLGDDVQKKELKHYTAYRRLKNFACLEIKPQAGHILIYLKGDYKNIVNPQAFIRDVSKVGHYGTGDVELKIKNRTEFHLARPFIETSYKQE